MPRQCCPELFLLLALSWFETRVRGLWASEFGGGRSDSVGQAGEVGGVGEHQRLVIKGDCPAPAWVSDMGFSYRDGIPGGLAEIFDNDPIAFTAAAGVDPHALTYRVLMLVHLMNLRHSESLRMLHPRT